MHLSQITTVMGRREQAIKHLGKWMESGIDELVVVCWNCPEHTGKWLTQESAFRDDHRLTVVDVPPEIAGNYFHLTRARNIGALASRFEFLLFLDVDCWVTTRYLDTIREQVDKNPRSAPEMFVSNTRAFDVEALAGEFPTSWVEDGQCIVRNHIFHYLHGYNEKHRQWGGESYDLYLRGVEFGARMALLPRSGLYTAPHGDQLRSRYLPPDYQFHNNDSNRAEAFFQSMRRLKDQRRHARATPGRRIEPPVKESCQIALYRGGHKKLWRPGEDDAA